MKRLTLGLFTGLFMSAMFWLSSAYFHISVSLVQGIVGSLLLTISCGIIGTISGVEKLLNNLPEL